MPHVSVGESLGKAPLSRSASWISHCGNQVVCGAEAPGDRPDDTPPASPSLLHHTRSLHVVAGSLCKAASESLHSGTGIPNKGSGAGRREIASAQVLARRKLCCLSGLVLGNHSIA